MTKRSRIAMAAASTAAALSILMAPAAFAANAPQTHGATSTTPAKTATHKSSKHAKVHHAKAAHAGTSATPAATTK